MPEKLRVAKKYFEVMLAVGICRGWDSPWSSGLHMVPKKDGTTRPCGDYRRLNDWTVWDAYPIPHIHDFLSNLAVCNIFLKIDLVKGYHQVPGRLEDVPKTAIATPFGLFEFTQMLFGLKNAAQTFQRLMDNITAKLCGVFVYLDDILVALTSAAHHESSLRELFSTLRNFGLVLNTSKCVFGVGQLEFLGHRISEQGIQPLPEKVKAMRRFERLQTVKLLQCFLGMVNFHRRFLPSIASTLRPLTDALAGVPHQLVWTDAMTSAFSCPKKRLVDAALLFHPFSGVKLRANTDAIHQVGDGVHQPLGFFSRQTTDAEAKYLAYNLELLAIYSTILKFRHMLEGRRFRIYTDQKPLTSAFMKAGDPVSNRQLHQLAFISEFATEITHIPGLFDAIHGLAHPSGKDTLAIMARLYVWPNMR